MVISKLTQLLLGSRQFLSSTCCLKAGILAFSKGKPKCKIIELKNFVIRSKGSYDEMSSCGIILSSQLATLGCVLAYRIRMILRLSCVDQVVIFQLHLHSKGVYENENLLGVISPFQSMYNNLLISTVTLRKDASLRWFSVAVLFSLSMIVISP